MNSLPYDDGEKSSRHTKRVLQLLGWRAQHVCWISFVRGVLHPGSAVGVVPLDAVAGLAGLASCS